MSQLYLIMYFFQNLTIEKLVDELSHLPLKHLAIEATPITKDSNYREKLIPLLPNLQELDSYPVWWKAGDPWQEVPEGFFGRR